MPTTLTPQLSLNSRDESGESGMCDLPGQRLLSTNQSLRFIVFSTVAGGRLMWTGPRSGGTA